jgi:hypothetical protein
MLNDERSTLESIARDECHDAFFLGLDAEGTTHWWSPYHQTMVLVDGPDAVATVPFRSDANDFSTLSDWDDYVADERGWTEGPRIATTDLDRSVQEAL